MSTQTVLFDAPGPKARNFVTGSSPSWGAFSPSACSTCDRQGSPIGARGDRGQVVALCRPGSVDRVPSPRPVGDHQGRSAPRCFSRASSESSSGWAGFLKVEAIRWFCGAVVEFFRAVPVYMMMVFAYYGWFARTPSIPADLAPLLAVVLALTLYNGSVIAEARAAQCFGLPRANVKPGSRSGSRTARPARTIQAPAGPSRQCSGARRSGSSSSRTAPSARRSPTPSCSPGPKRWARRTRTPCPRTSSRAHVHRARLRAHQGCLAHPGAPQPSRHAGRAGRRLPTLVQGAGAPGVPTTAGARHVRHGVERGIGQVEERLEDFRERPKDQD